MCEEREGRQGRQERGREGASVSVRREREDKGGIKMEMQCYTLHRYQSM